LAIAAAAIVAEGFKFWTTAEMGNVMAAFQAGKKHEARKQRETKSRVDCLP
jgi:hypothetical protein